MEAPQADCLTSRRRHLPLDASGTLAYCTRFYYRTHGFVPNSHYQALTVLYTDNGIGGRQVRNDLPIRPACPRTGGLNHRQAGVIHSVSTTARSRSQVLPAGRLRCQSRSALVSGLAPSKWTVKLPRRTRITIKALNVGAAKHSMSMPTPAGRAYAQP